MGKQSAGDAAAGEGVRATGGAQRAGGAGGAAERQPPLKVVPFIQLDLNPDMDDGSDEFEEVSGSENESDSD